MKRVTEWKTIRSKVRLRGGHEAPPSHEEDVTRLKETPTLLSLHSSSQPSRNKNTKEERLREGGKTTIDRKAKWKGG